MTPAEINVMPGDMILSWLTQEGYSPIVRCTMHPASHGTKEDYAVTILLSDGKPLASHGETLQEAVRDIGLTVLAGRAQAAKVIQTMTEEELRNVWP